MSVNRSINAEVSDDDISFKHVQLKARRDQEAYRHVAILPPAHNLNSSYFEPVFRKQKLIKSAPVIPLDPNLKNTLRSNLLCAHKLNPLTDAPEKNCRFLVPEKRLTSSECLLSSLADIVCRTLRETSCDYDVKESTCKWKGVCHGYSSFVAFTVQIYFVTMKGCGSCRHVVVVQRLSGESIPFRKLYNSLKAAVCGVACPQFRQHSLNFGGSDQCDSSWNHDSIEKEIGSLFKMSENKYLDQQIFALKAISKLVQSDRAAKLVVASSSQFMKNLLNIFEFTDARYCQLGKHCHLISELQLHTTRVLGELSEEPSCISFLVQSGVLLKCFDSLYFIAKYEAQMNLQNDEFTKHHRNIQFWYRQSQREIAKCLRNITTCPTVDAVERLQEEGVEQSKLMDWCSLTNHFSCENVRSDAKRFIPVF